MNYRYFTWILPFLIFTAATYAVDLEEECINEPVFNGSVCIYQANRNYKKTIFLIHGIGDNASRDWEMQVPALAQYYRIITVDLPGYGHSDKGDKNYTPDKYVALINFIATYYGINRFDMVGHSMGGAISILYASKFPENVRRLVVVDVAGILHRLAIAKYVIASASNKNGGNTVSSINTIETYVVKVIEKFEWLFSLFSDDIAEKDERIRSGIELANYNFGDALDKIETPTLIVWGEDDRITPLRTAKVLAYRIKNSKIEVIKGAGHLPMKDRFEEFNDLLVDYLHVNDVKNNIVKKFTDFASNKDGLCERNRGVNFSGNFSRLEIINCSEVTINNARIDELFVYESRVTIDGSSVGGDVPIAIKSIGSDIKITASKISGDIALEVDRSRIDFAAVDIHIMESTILGISKSRFIFSVSRLYDGVGMYHIHDSVILNSGDSDDVTNYFWNNSRDILAPH